MEIKNWYLKNFPDDEMGEEINEKVTFCDLFIAMDGYKSVYSFIGVNDSIVRERIFEKLSEIMNIDYDYIYQQWLLCHD